MKIKELKAFFEGLDENLSIELIVRGKERMVGGDLHCVTADVRPKTGLIIDAGPVQCVQLWGRE